MLNAQPDPGAMRSQEIKRENAMTYFVNGFAANDPVSTLNIWERIKSQGYPTKYPIVLMNCRADRVDRTIQFANDVLPYLPIDTLVLIGEEVDPIKDAIKSGKIKVSQMLDLQRSEERRVGKESKKQRRRKE